MARLVRYTPSAGAIELTPESFNALEAAIRWAEVEVPQRFNQGMNMLAQHMALVNQAEARTMSAGQWDVSQSQPGAAWKIPVRRITGRYFVSWRVRARGKGAWELYNNSREAYFIEFGISEVGWGAGRHVPKGRVRRPVRKLSLRKTLEYMMRTQAYHRVWADIFSSPRHRHRGMGFSQIVQSPGGGHMVWRTANQNQAGQAIRAGKAVRIRRGGFQIRSASSGGGSYGGPMLGRKLP